MIRTTVSLIAGAVIIAGSLVIASGNFSGNNAGVTASIVDGVQIVEIDAKGGYSPRITDAKAGIPTVLKVKTAGTFDCSSAIAIPSLGYRENLPSSGITEINIPPQKPGSKIQGLCAMGMYNFQIKFN
jgi:plastocyanin domain-containing protein